MKLDQNWVTCQCCMYITKYQVSSDLSSYQLVSYSAFKYTVITPTYLPPLVLQITSDLVQIESDSHPCKEQILNCKSTAALYRSSGRLHLFTIVNVTFYFYGICGICVPSSAQRVLAFKSLNSHWIIRVTQLYSVTFGERLTFNC